MDDAELILLRATVRKLRAERKVMHEMLTDVGVRDDVLGDGVRTCLIGRLAIAIHQGPVSNTLMCLCGLPVIKAQGHGLPDHCSVHGDIDQNLSIANHIVDAHGMSYEKFRDMHRADCPLWK